MPTAYAASRRALPVCPHRTRREPIGPNREGEVHPMYGYLYVADKHEGLIVIGAATTIDGNPTNNFLHREVTFNPKGAFQPAAHS